jgi:hypothetical protein
LFTRSRASQSDQEKKKVSLYARCNRNYRNKRYISRAPKISDYYNESPTHSHVDIVGSNETVMRWNKGKGKFVPVLN